MIHLRPLLLCALIAAAALSSAGCRHAVQFQPNAPYSARWRVDAPLVVIVPDEVLAGRHRELVRTTLISEKYDIFYGQALVHQLEARFRPSYSSYRLLPEGLYEMVMEDRLDEEIARLRKAKAPDAAIAALMDLDFSSADIRSGEGYLMRFTRFDLLMASGRPAVFAEVEYIDRATGEAIGDWRLRGRGRASNIGQDQRFNTERFREATSSAISQMLLELSREIAPLHDGR